MFLTRMTKTRSRGFTLIELLVVIAIIGILASIILARVNSARRNALRSEVLADVYEIRKAAELYLSSNPSGNYPADQATSIDSYTIPSFQCKDPGGKLKFINFGDEYGGMPPGQGVNGACVGVTYWDTANSGWIMMWLWDVTPGNGCATHQARKTTVEAFADYVVSKCF